MESSIAVFLLRQFAYEQLPTWDMQCARPCLGWELIMHGARLCVAPCCVDVLCDHLSGAWRVEASGLVAPPSPTLPALISQSMAVRRCLREEALGLLGASVAQWEGARLAS